MKQNKPAKIVKPFLFKKFSIAQDHCAMKVGTDSVLLGAWADVQDSNFALDIGTGTGLIAIMLAQRNTNLTVHAVEIHEASGNQAAENIKQSPFADRLDLFTLSIQEYASQTDRRYSLIVSNPPFFNESLLSKTEHKRNARHTTTLRHDELLAAVKKLLMPNGKFCVILPVNEAEKFKNTAGNEGLYCTRCCEVKPRAAKPIERIMMQFEPNDKTDCIHESITILVGEGRHDYSKSYVKLVRDFYTIL